MRNDFQFTKTLVIDLIQKFYSKKTGNNLNIGEAANFLYEYKNEKRKEKDYEVLDWCEPDDDNIESAETVIKIKRIRRISDSFIIGVDDIVLKHHKVVGIIKHGYEVFIVTLDTTEFFSLCSFKLDQITI